MNKITNRDEESSSFSINYDEKRDNISTDNISTDNIPIVSEFVHQVQNGTKWSISTDNVKVVVFTKEHEQFSSIIGFFNNKTLFDITDDKLDLLIRAINNRTRERNYFRLYCQLLEKEINDDDFDKEIEENEDDYVTSADQDASKEDFQFALDVSSKIKDVKDASDMIDLFSFNDSSTLKYIKNDKLCKGR